ncbi:MAG: hypothetical protein ACYDG6_01620 [Thermincolia bacterium]
MYYLWLVLGNPLAFVEAQKFWKRGLDFPWASIYGAVDAPFCFGAVPYVSGLALLIRRVLV